MYSFTMHCVTAWLKLGIWSKMEKVAILIGWYISYFSRSQPLLIFVAEPFSSSNSFVEIEEYIAPVFWSSTIFVFLLQFYPDIGHGLFHLFFCMAISWSRSCFIVLHLSIMCVYIWIHLFCVMLYCN